jgi:hypothetical protein
MEVSFNQKLSYSSQMEEIDNLIRILLELIAVKSSFLRIFTWILLKLRASPIILTFLATQNTRFSILPTLFSIQILYFTFYFI